MRKIDNPSEVTFFVQWELDPFPNPQIDHHKIENTKKAIQQTKEVLKTILEQSEDIKIASNYNGKVAIIIGEPELKDGSNIEMNEIVFSALKNCPNVVEISVFVNNDISEKIAINKADIANKHYHTGYNGKNKETLIYHK